MKKERERGKKTGGGDDGEMEERRKIIRWKVEIRKSERERNEKREMGEKGTG